MPIPSFALVTILRETADRLESGDAYQWSHFGRCNCGHLVQTVTRLSPAEIHAVCSPELLEWSEIPDDYCAGTGLKLEYVLDRLRELGLSREDLRQVEDLSDSRVLRALPGGHRWLQRNRREDVVSYFRTWATLLEAEAPDAPDLQPGPGKQPQNVDAPWEPAGGLAR
ncbi:MAG TPA: hypothetical protein PKX00_02030 [Opitutaceae bacterium]|jgi:hypothetical protein|nr:hypothetical protein [Opitutaceae bacterium]HRE04355.1 hypothetical protein [Opitutaceae bacterium]